ncbi:type II toxin-antitoxin system RelE family toxin [Streptomyces melanogenes]|uniref:type II toxin-antitoxin system RelE family toxin n=1 Tax=Streptomyces melanogenes TaxID=67326 RepID=UPI00167DC6AF|nr:hypothetical protein [Streptomyces melanogenes]GGP80062.1 hypothetical protein GCM10010278_68120 [Streptomyces melanogenes]
MSRPYRIVYAPEAVEDLAALGKGEALREAIEAALADPYGGMSLERPMGGGHWDRVALVGTAAVRYSVSDAPGITPPTVTVTRVIV